MDGAEEKQNYRFYFPTIDFKLQNRSNIDAFIRRFQVEVLSVEVDTTPVMSFGAEFDEKCLYLKVKNHGWGDISNFEVRLSEAALDKVFGDTLCQTITRIGEDEVKIPICLNDLSFAKLQSLEFLPHMAPPEFRYINRETQSYPYQFGDREEREAQRIDEVIGVKLEDIQIRWSAIDGKGSQQHSQSQAYIGHVVLIENGFIEAKWAGSIPHPYGYSSDRTCITSIRLDSETPGGTLDYPISRIIPARGNDRFHVLVGATQSCIVIVRFLIVIDEYTVVRSKDFEFHLWNPRNQEFHRYYPDGAELLRREEEINQILLSGNYPGDHPRLKRELETIAQAKAGDPNKGPYPPSTDY